MADGGNGRGVWFLGGLSGLSGRFPGRCLRGAVRLWRCRYAAVGRRCRGLPELGEVLDFGFLKTACDAAAGSGFRGGDCSVLPPAVRGEGKSRREFGGFCVRAVAGGLGRRGDCSTGVGLAMRGPVYGASGLIRVGLAAGVGVEGLGIAVLWCFFVRRFLLRGFPSALARQGGVPAAGARLGCWGVRRALGHGYEKTAAFKLRRHWARIGFCVRCIARFVVPGGVDCAAGFRRFLGGLGRRCGGFLTGDR